MIEYFNSHDTYVQYRYKNTTVNATSQVSTLVPSRYLLIAVQ